VKAAPEVIREVTDYVEKKEYHMLFEALLADIDEKMAAKEKAEAENLIFQQRLLAVEQRAQDAERDREAAERRAAELERRIREAGLSL
jgi:hypothetical protein